jgi:hypothetical protein
MHEVNVLENLTSKTSGHIGHYGTAIEAGEKLAKKTQVPEAQPTKKKKRGRPGKSETCEAIPENLSKSRANH